MFKIQANLDPGHRDRVAFLRVCYGSYRKGMKMRHVRIGKMVQVANAITFQADERQLVEEAWPGDIIGLHTKPVNASSSGATCRCRVSRGRGVGA